MRKLLFLLLLQFCIVSIFAQEKKISLEMVDVVPGKDKYYFALLKNSLERCGYNVDLDIKTDIPLSRVAEYLATSKISLHFYMDTAMRRKNFPVFANVGLTNGLVGKRVLFIPKSCASMYSKVQTLDDFRKLNKIGAFGEGWTDAKIWTKNNLKLYEKSGDYRLIFNMLSSRRRNIDYFSRSVMEILDESTQYQLLDIEPRLLFTYNMDFKFFFSPDAAKWKDVVEEALKKAQSDGYMEKLLREYYPAIYSPEGLNMLHRVDLPLELPEEFNLSGN